MKINCTMSINPAFKAVFSREEQILHMDKAKATSRYSKCMKNKAGVVIVSENGESFLGYNAPPSGLINPCEVSGKCPRIEYDVPSGTLHDCTHQNVDAEASALLKAGNKAKGGTLFLFGHYHLCDSCKRLSILAGIKDFYIQCKEGDPISHFSISDIIAETNNNFESSFAKFVQMAKKSLKK